MSEITPEKLFSQLLRLDDTYVHLKFKLTSEPEVRARFDEQLYQLLSDLVTYICEKEDFDDSKVTLP